MVHAPIEPQKRCHFDRTLSAAERGSGETRFSTMEATVSLSSHTHKRRHFDRTLSAAERGSGETCFSSDVPHQPNHQKTDTVPPVHPNPTKDPPRSDSHVQSRTPSSPDAIVLICFSRAIAAEAEVKRSNQTSLSHRYALVKPPNRPSRCCLTRILMSLVKPTYNTRLRSATRYT